MSKEETHLIAETRIQPNQHSLLGPVCGLAKEVWESHFNRLNFRSLACGISIFSRLTRTYSTHSWPVPFGWHPENLVQGPFAREHTQRHWFLFFWAKFGWNSSCSWHYWMEILAPKLFWSSFLCFLNLSYIYIYARPPPPRSTFFDVWHELILEINPLLSWLKWIHTWTPIQMAPTNNTHKPHTFSYPNQTFCPICITQPLTRHTKQVDKSINNTKWVQTYVDK